MDHHTFLAAGIEILRSPSDYIQLLDNQLIKIGGQNNTKKPPNIHLM